MQPDFLWFIVASTTRSLQFTTPKIIHYNIKLNIPIYLKRFLFCKALKGCLGPIAVSSASDGDIKDAAVAAAGHRGLITCAQIINVTFPPSGKTVTYKALPFTSHCIFVCIAVVMLQNAHTGGDVSFYFFNASI